jgi:hypothetical protein
MKKRGKPHSNSTINEVEVHEENEPQLKQVIPVISFISFLFIRL